MRRTQGTVIMQPAWSDGLKAGDKVRIWTRYGYEYGTVARMVKGAPEVVNGLGAEVSHVVLIEKWEE